MEAFLPFGCPSCGMPSVAVGICPECRVALVARALAPESLATPFTPTPEAEEGVSVFRGTVLDCRRVAQRLSEAGVWAALVPEPKQPFLQVLVQPQEREQAQTLIEEDWEREAEAQGLSSVAGTALEGGCPACGEGLPEPEQAECPSCGIALA